MKALIKYESNLDQYTYGKIIRIITMERYPVHNSEFKEFLMKHFEKYSKNMTMHDKMYLPKFFKYCQFEKGWVQSSIKDIVIPDNLNKEI